MKSKDWVSLIETSYSLESDDESWVMQVLDRAAPLFDRGWWPTIAVCRYTPTTFVIDHVETKGPAIIKTSIRKSETLPQEVINIIFRGRQVVGTLSEVLFSHSPEQVEVHRRMVRGIVRDTLSVYAYSGMESTLALTVGFLKQTTATPQERKRWPLVASHLGAGLRLRRLAQHLSLDSTTVEAIFDSGGKLHEARAKAQEPSLRERLRATVQLIDRLRTREGRSDPDAAMEAWEGLVEGRWSLVDHFDTDRRRFVVAIKNDPTYPDPRGLTMRERQVAEFVGLGHSCKEISYTLGVSQSAITNCTARAQSKLGLASLAELAAFFAPNGLRAKLAEVAIQGENLIVGAYPLINEDRIKGLTEAERAVLAHLVAGSTNSDIAQRRDTSEYTVANQVKAIFRKLKVSSRSELAARLQSVA